MKDEDWVWAVLLLGFIFWLVSRSSTEGIYESNFITCEKPADSKKWRNAVIGANRRGAIYEIDYQVSFAHQRVVTELPAALNGCTVFNRNNWSCAGPTTVQDGDMNPQCWTLSRPECRVSLGWVTHPLVYIGGADWMCHNQSSRLDVWHEGEMRRQRMMQN